MRMMVKSDNLGMGRGWRRAPLAVGRDGLRGRRAMSPGVSVATKNDGGADARCWCVPTLARAPAADWPATRRRSTRW